MKQNWKPCAIVNPVPAVLVSCGDKPENYNMLTVAWTGTICSEPAMAYVSIRPERHSYEIVKRTGEFVINLTTEALAEATDWCGVRSGRNFDKFKECGLTPGKSAVVAAPSIAESPISIECRVKQIVPLGSHDMFIGEVVNVAVDEQYIDAETGKLCVEKMRLLAYAHGAYFTLGEQIGTFGWTVKGSTLRKELKQGKKRVRNEK
ncbi:MAG: flavin reductase family protein [Alistipes sp.]|nr:flavin reductase family protein [Alistipes sp.]